MTGQATGKRSGLGASRGAPRSAASVVLDARAKERAGCIPEAMEHYEAAIAIAERDGERGVLAEALRRLGAVYHQRDNLAQASELCTRSYHVSLEVGSGTLASEALNVLGIVELHSGRMEDARITFQKALMLAESVRDIRARIEGNLGIVAQVEGDFSEALAHYHRSLDASRQAGDEHSCAIAHVNLAITATQLGKYDLADEHFNTCREIAERTGDVFLTAACMVNHAEVHIARQRYEDARRDAESSLATFDQLGARADKAQAYRVIGVVYRETGRLALAESRLRSSIDLARASGSAIKEAEACRELAELYQSTGRNQDALAMLNAAHRLFGALNARVDLVNVDSKVAELEAAYVALVKEWGQSIESSDTYTYGHCGRVAENAERVARQLGLDEQELTAIRLGAYLHDVGKVKVPHELLNKPGALTHDEFEIVKLHTMWGVELLEDVEFPWDIKAVIRWHHEKFDGSGYPDRLRGDEIPVSAQIVGIVDVYDALTTDRPYRPALTHAEAVAEITRACASWSPRVFEAFLACWASHVAA